MRRRIWQRTWRISLFLLALIVGGSLYAWWPIRGTTADGTTTIELLHVGAGSFDYESDDALMTFLRKWLPKPALKHLPPRISLSRRPPYNDAGSLKLQMLFSYKQNLGPDPGPKSGLRPQVQFIDSAGRVHIGHWDRRSQNMSGFMYLGFDAWPRRERVLHCRVVNKIDGRHVLEFKIRNPDFRPNAPRWTPRPLPDTAGDEEVRVTLKGFKPPSKRGLLVPDVEVESLTAGRRYRLGPCFVEDATGNSGDGVIATETAWRVHVRVIGDEPGGSTKEFQFDTAPVVR